MIITGTSIVILLLLLPPVLPQCHSTAFWSQLFICSARPCVAEFVQGGSQVVCCVIKGVVHLLSTDTHHILQSISCPAASSLRQIRAGYSKDILTHLLLQRDKSLQVITLNPNDYSEDGLQEYEDPVNRIGWVDGDVSRNCEYLGGALADPREHKLYISYPPKSCTGYFYWERLFVLV